MSEEEVKAEDAAEAAEEEADGVEARAESDTPAAPVKSAGLFGKLFQKLGGAGGGPVHYDKTVRGEGGGGAESGDDHGGVGDETDKGKEGKDDKLRKKAKDVKNIVLVGNGKSVLKKKLGSKVDEADLVGRFNFFRLRKYEESVGRRVDLWFIGELRQPGPVGHRGSKLATGKMDLKIKPKRYVVPVVYPLPKRCSRKNTKACNPSRGALGQRSKTIRTVKRAYGKYKLNDRLEIMPLAVQNALATKYHYYGQWPSSGILAIVYCLEKYPGSVVSIMGYDFAHKALGHYWEKVRKKSTVHAMSAEGRFVERLIVEGKVKHLT